VALTLGVATVLISQAGHDRNADVALTPTTVATPSTAVPARTATPASVDAATSVVTPVPAAPEQVTLPAAGLPKPVVAAEPFVLKPAVLPALSSWEQSIRRTALAAAPADDAVRFTELPIGEYVKVVERTRRLGARCVRW
jgi:hypothetical protein